MHRYPMNWVGTNDRECWLLSALCWSWVLAWWTKQKSKEINIFFSCLILEIDIDSIIIFYGFQNKALLELNAPKQLLGDGGASRQQVTTSHRDAVSSSAPWL